MGKADNPVHIDDVSRRLEAWLSQLLPDAQIEFSNAYPTKSIKEKQTPPKKTQVMAHFHSIVMEKLDRATLSPDRHFILTYEIDIEGRTAFESQRAYSEIYFNAFSDDDWLIEPAEQSGARQAPSAGPLPLRLQTKIPRASQLGLAPPVTGRMNVEMTGLGRIAGQVTSAEGTPIPRAYVEAPSLGRRLMTDNNGKFVINGAPRAGAVAISVTARGRVVRLSVDVASAKELAIIMAMEEENA